MTQAKWNDLPELPFELILRYLSLEDRIKFRRVSKGWKEMIDSSKVKTLCFSDHPAGFILNKNRWVRGAFAQNFISSPNFESFFQTFGQSLISSLKHLRLCKTDFRAEKVTILVQTLNSFKQLEELSLIGIRCSPKLVTDCLVTH